MEDVASNLESLVQKATNPRNHITDTAAVVEICNILNKEPYCAHIATRVIANKIQSPQEWEALQALNLLDTCMKHCGVGFHAEVGKFRFLNEMIKLVSPKYLGGRTAVAVRQRVLLLMHTWTVDYPRETKIREAYDMLKKQGVVKEEPPYISTASMNQKETPVAPPPPRPKNSIFEDEERSRLLQKLLQSKNPDDLQAANRLIKTMVKEDEYRVEMNSRRITELESVHNNVRLLSEMLDQYRPGQTSAEELELIKELHQSCERLRPNVFRLASETQDNEAMLNEVLSASDELGQVFDKYTAIIVQGKRPQPQNSTTKSGSASLLDLSTPSEEKLPPVPVELLGNQLADLGLELGTQVSTTSQPSGTMGDKQSNLEALGDIFGSIASPKPPGPSPSAVGVNSILQPVSVQQSNSKGTSPSAVEPEKPSKLKALEDLDALGKSLLKQSLPSSCKVGSQFTRPAAKVPMNLLSKTTTEGSHNQSSADALLTVGTGGGDAVSPTSSMDLDFLIGDAVKARSNEATSGPGDGGGGRSSTSSDLLNGSLVNGSGADDSMVDLSEDVAELTHEESAASGAGSISEQNSRLAEALMSASTRQGTEALESSSGTNTAAVSNGGVNVSSTVNSPARRVEVKPLTDISVPLETIKPGSIPPLTVLDEKNGITVILNFGKDGPRPDVSVIVVTTISKNSSAISNYLFQAVVPKTCKLRLQAPSGSDLPAHNPFLPPAAITQVMLIANPNKDPVSLKFMISFTMDDETVTEMGEVERLPLST
ncbi:ADP-ribosylation factor-binding protein GGA1 isoform X2 [Periplaneta americana]|uniref:ADP-ribosylation factor-binding protein GGA1 isoform X2 n=1 Tax=Periplaneta americana TaxID=6978 RepID=UPI0037E80A1D